MEENADRNASHHTRRCVRGSHKAPFTTSCLGTNSRLLSNYGGCWPEEPRKRVCENVATFIPEFPVQIKSVLLANNPAVARIHFGVLARTKGFKTQLHKLPIFRTDFVSMAVDS